MFCPNCGSEINEDDNFCVNCGNTLKEVKEEVSDSNRRFFNKSTDDKKTLEKEALDELNSYKDNNNLKIRQILPRFGINNFGFSEGRFFGKVLKNIKKEIKNDGLTADKIESRIFDYLREEYGEPLSQEETNEKFYQEKLQRERQAEAERIEKERKAEQEKLEKEMQLEKKFGVQFQNRTWFKCTVEEMRHSTFSNTNQRDVLDGYVFVEDAYLEIIKESVFLKSKMGTRKIFFDNIASIDHDARGLLNLSSNLEIYLKSSDKIQLKHVSSKMVNLVTGKYNEYMENKINNHTESTSSQDNANSNIDELMKYADLYERGLLTKEEFEQKKKELL